VAAPLVERLSGVVVFSEDDRVADYEGVRRTILRWQRWPVRQWWRRLAAPDPAAQQQQPEPEAEVEPVGVLAPRELSSLGEEQDTPLLPASERQRWEMSVLQVRMRLVFLGFSVLAIENHHLPRQAQGKHKEMERRGVFSQIAQSSHASHMRVFPREYEVRPRNHNSMVLWHYLCNALLCYQREVFPATIGWTMWSLALTESVNMIRLGRGRSDWIGWLGASLTTGPYLGVQDCRNESRDSQACSSKGWVVCKHCNWN
jgi:hypothetical protein